MDRPRTGSRGVVLISSASLIAAVVFVVLATALSFYVPDADDTYGAPLPIGASCFDLPTLRCATTFNPLWFIVNVLLTTGVLLVLGRWSGVSGIGAAGVGAIVGLALIPLLLAYNAPIVGLPIPLRPVTPLHISLAIWLDAVAWAAL